MLVSRRLCIVLFTVVAVAASLSAFAQTGGEIVLSVEITDATGNPIHYLDPDTNGPTMLGGDFMVHLRTSDASGLATYAQKIVFNSNKIKFITGAAMNALPTGLGLQQGNLVVNAADAENGANSAVRVAATGISGYSGEERLFSLAFEAVENGTITIGVEDDENSTSTYATSDTEIIPHTSPGISATGFVGVPSAVNDGNWSLYE